MLPDFCSEESPDKVLPFSSYSRLVPGITSSWPCALLRLRIRVPDIVCKFESSWTDASSVAVISKEACRGMSDEEHKSTEDEDFVIGAYRAIFRK